MLRTYIENRSATITSLYIIFVINFSPMLTLRDIHALLSFSGRIPSSTNRDWYVNGAGMLVSHQFGAGLLNVAKMVNLALGWTNIGPLKIVHFRQGKQQSDQHRSTYRSALDYKHLAKYVKLVCRIF